MIFFAHLGLHCAVFIQRYLSVIADFLENALVKIEEDMDESLMYFFTTHGI